MWKLTVLFSRESTRRRGRALPNSSELHAQWQACETTAAIFSGLSLIPATLDYELRYAKNRDHSNCLSNSFPDVYRWLVLALTLSALFFLGRSYILKRHWLMLKFSRRSYAQQLIRYYRKWKFLTVRLVVEMLLLCIFPYPILPEVPLMMEERLMISLSTPAANPVVNYCLLLSELLYCLMVIRVFFVLRAFLNYSIFADSTARRICAQFGEMADFSFNVRAMARKDPHLFILALIVILAFVFTIPIRTLERPYQEVVHLDWGGVINSMWFTATTLDISPYGDYFTNTHPGRVFSYILAILCLCLTSIAYTLMFDYVDMSSNEMYVYESIQASRLAAKVIERWYIYRKTLRTQTGTQGFALRSRFHKAAEAFAYQLPRLSYRLGLSERQQSKKFQQMIDLDYSLWKIDSKLGTGLTKVEIKLTRSQALLRKAEVLLAT